jgi:putative endonuclease
VDFFLLNTLIMYTVYAIKSGKKDWIYVGMTENLERRLQQHNKGYNTSTKPYAPFDLIYSEQQPTREAARTREKYLKTTTGKSYLRSMFQKPVSSDDTGLSTDR